MSELTDWYKKELIKEFNKNCEEGIVRTAKRDVSTEEIGFKYTNGVKADVLAEEYGLNLATIYYHIRKYKNKTSASNILKPTREKKINKRIINSNPVTTAGTTVIIISNSSDLSAEITNLVSAISKSARNSK